jgi:cell division protein FtsA
VAGLAAAEAVLDRRQKECGTAIVDMGAATINIAILEDGEIEHIAVIPVGGQNITNDLAIGLKTDLDIAEKVKRSFPGLGSLPSYECKIEHNGEKIVFDGPTVQMIIEARLEEMMEQIDREFAKVKKSKKLPGGVVFVGGTASLKGLSDFAKEKLELPATIGTVKGLSGLLDGVKDPSMATPVGVMMLDSFFATGGHQQEIADGWLGQINLFGKLKSLRKKRG